MADDTTLTARLDDSDVKAKLTALNQMADTLQRKLQGLSTGAGGGGIPGSAPPPVSGAAGSTPPINAGSSRAQGVAPPPSGPPPSGGNVGVNANGIPMQPIVRTATDGTQVTYNPQTGQWATVAPTVPPINAGSATPPPVPSGAAPVATATATATASPRRGGMGMRGAIAGYMAARVGGEVANTLAQNYIESQRTGRETQWYDRAGLYGAGIFAATGAIAGGVFGGPGGAILGGSIASSLGNQVGDAIGGVFKQKEDNDLVRAQMVALAGRGGQQVGDEWNALGVKTKERQTTMGLAMAMALGGGTAQQASNLTSQLLGQANNNGQRLLREQQLQGMAKAMGENPALTPLNNGAYSAATAFAFLQTGGPDALGGYLAHKALGASQQPFLATLGASMLAEQHAELMGLYPQQADYATQGIVARGGTASQIAGSMGGEVSALQDAARAQKDYIASLERMGTATDTQRIAIEKARTELAGLNAQIATLGNAAATVKMQEAVDIAGTNLATAGAGTSIAMMTMQRGGNIMGAFAPTLSAQAAMVSTLQEQVNAPNLRPEQRRELQRQLAGARVAQMQGMRSAADASFGFPAALAVSDAGYSASYAAIAGMGETNPVAAAALTGRVGAAQGTAAAALWTKYRGMSASGLYDAVSLAEARNAAWGMAAQGLSTLNASSVFSPTATQQAGLAGFGLQSFVGGRAGGSMGALSGYQGALGMLGTMGGQAAEVYRNALARGANPAVALANYQQATATLGMQQAQMTAALGNFQLSPTTGSALDTAQHAYNMMMASPFVPGNRLTAGTGVLSALGTARSEAEKYLATAPLDAQGRRDVQAQIYGYQEQEQRLRESLNVGWIGRIASREIMAPSHSAMVGVSNRDYLMVDPTGNRLFGTASRRSYEYTEGGAYAAMPGTGAGNRPGDMNTQAVHMVGTLELTGNVGEFLKGNGVSARVSVRTDPRQSLMRKAPTG